MKTYTVTSKDLDKNNNYIGKLDVANLDGNLEIEESLGIVTFRSLNVLGYIFAKAGCGIEAGCGIIAGSGIEADYEIKAGSGIEAGCGIEAGYGIKAGSGIEAGYGINCKLELKFNYRLFAGISIYQNEEIAIKDIICGKLVGPGKVCYGNVKELGLPSDEKKSPCNMSEKVVKVEIDGVKYEAIIK